MSLVGDIIVGFRDLAPDPCQSLNPPVWSGGISVGGSNPFPSNATVFIKLTQGTPWGETTSLEQTFTNTVAFGVTLTAVISQLATFVRVYWTYQVGTGLAGSGLEDQYLEFPVSVTNVFTTTLYAIQTPTLPNTYGQGVPPNISRAWLPDSDGNILSASRVYNWMREGLKLMGPLTGGIRDITGIPSTIGQAQYKVVGLWQHIDNNFYDGYPIAAGQKQQIFRHNSVTGLSGVLTANVSADRQFVELWPQSQRTAGSGQLSSPMGQTDVMLSASGGITGFVLPFGLLLMGTYPPIADYGPGSCELMYYSNLNSTFITQITRGMGGTQPQTWAAGTPFYECNIFLTGLRQPQMFYKGQSAYTFTCPPSFEDAIRNYLMYRFKDAEQNVDEADKKYKLFKEICDQIQQSKQFDGPRQIQIGGSGGVEIAVGLGSPFGGVIVP